MNTSGVKFELPFCSRSEEDTKTGRNARITAFVIGVIFLLVGFLAFCEGFGNGTGMDNPAWVVGLIAILLVVGSSTRFKEDKKKKVDFTSSEWYLSEATSQPLPEFKAELAQQFTFTPTPLYSTAPIIGEDIHFKNAEAFLRNREKESAFKEILKVMDSESRESLLAQLADSYLFEVKSNPQLKEENRKKAYQIIQSIIFDRETKEKLLVDLTWSYLFAFDYKMALEVVQSIIHDHVSKDKLLIEITKAYLVDKKLLEAFNALKLVVYDSEKTGYLISIAKEYLKAGKPNEAFEAVKMMAETSENEKLLNEICHEYFKKNDRQHAAEVIGIVASRVVLEKLAAEQKETSYLGYLSTVDGRQRDAEFFITLANKIYDRIGMDYSNIDILSSIKNVALESYNSLPFLNQ